MKSKRFSEIINVFHGRTAPEEGHLAGYASIMNAYNLQTPVPNFVDGNGRLHRYLIHHVLLRKEYVAA